MSVCVGAKMMHLEVIITNFLQMFSFIQFQTTRKKHSLNILENISEEYICECEIAESNEMYFLKQFL